MHLINNINEMIVYNLLIFCIIYTFSNQVTNFLFQKRNYHHLNETKNA